MAEVNTIASPTFRRTADFLEVEMYLEGKTDEIWGEIFAIKASAPDVSDFELRYNEDRGMCAVLSLPLTISDEDATKRVERLVQFVDEVDADYIERMKAIDRLEKAIAKLFGPPEPLTNRS